MALTGQDVYVAISDGSAVEVGLLTSFKMGEKSNTLSRKGLAGWVKNRLTSYEYYASVQGDITTYEMANALNTPASEFDINVNDMAISDAVVESFKLECEEGDTLKYTADFIGKTITSAVAQTSQADPGDVFILADAATLTLANDARRTITPVYGNQLSPTDFSKGTWEHTATITLTPEDSLEMIAAVAETGNENGTFTAKFENSSGEKVYIVAGGMVADEASFTADPDNAVEVPINFKIATLTISGS
jgi:hypothetical protein